MEVQFGLALADARLLQSWHLLRKTMNSHPDNDAIADAVESVRTAREIITNLRNP